MTREKTAGFGILVAEKDGRITEFVEKPSPQKDISHLRMPETLMTPEMKAEGKEYLASMGIYIFSAGVLEKALDNDCTDFGKEIIPRAIETMKVNAYTYDGFWEDIGTIKSFYEANVNLAAINPDFNFYDEDRPIYTHKRHLPASKFNFCTISQALTADGCIITNASIENSLIGIRTLIESGTNLDGVVCMGADYYETAEQKRENREKGIPDIGIGRGTVIKRAIIDKNARIGDGCRIGIDDIVREPGDFGNYYIADGIIVVPKNAIIPSGTVI